MSRNIAYVSISEWNKKVMRWIWIGVGIVLFIQLLLFAFYQPVPECSRSQYLEIFVLRPSITLVLEAGCMELIFRLFGRILGEHVITIVFRGFEKISVNSI